MSNAIEHSTGPMLIDGDHLCNAAKYSLRKTHEGQLQ
jgi:hypothetical protein